MSDNGYLLLTFITSVVHKASSSKTLKKIFKLLNPMLLVLSFMSELLLKKVTEGANFNLSQKYPQLFEAKVSV